MLTIGRLGFFPFSTKSLTSSPVNVSYSNSVSANSLCSREYFFRRPCYVQEDKVS